MTDVLVLFPATAAVREALERRFGSRCRICFREPDWSDGDLYATLASAQVILGEPRLEDLGRCPRLELVQSSSSGVNYYLQGGFPPGVKLCSATGAYGRVLAEHMLAMTLALCRRLPEYQDQQSLHRWQLLRYDKQLDGCTALILGAGDIGTTLAGFLRPMVGRIIGMRRTERPCPPCFDEMITLGQLDDYLPRADLVLCALPHTPETRGLLDERRLRRIKEDAVLVNGGRGSLIDQEALCRLLQEGRFWGVGLEVAYPEPLPREHPLWHQPRLMITPHAAGNSFSQESPLYRRVWDRMTDNLERHLTGMPLQSQIDFEQGYRALE